MSDVSDVALLYQDMADALTEDRPCEGYEHPDPARWWCVMGCGCGVWAYCETCHTTVLDMVKGGQIMGCAMCNAVNAHPRFERIV